MGENRGQGNEGRRGESVHTTPGLQDDQLYRVLASRPRRRLLYYLNDVGQSTVGELAEVLVGWETSEKGGMATETEYDWTVIRLQHSHLPMLAEAGLVTYDEETGVVDCEPLDDAVTDLLARSIADETA
jgi:DNA-binding transcriptional ArsR family regulator